MQVEFKDLNAVTREISITVEAERVEKAYQKYLAKAARDVEVPGFRKGKAPLQMIERLHGERIKDYFEKDFIDEVFDEAAKEHEIHYLLFPEVKEVAWERGNDMQITLEIEHEPAVEFKQLEGLQVPFKPALLDEQVELFVENLAKEHTTAQDVDVAEKDDQLDIELAMELNGSPFTNNVTMYAGDDLTQRSLPEFIGVKTGDTIQKELSGAMIKLLTMERNLPLGDEDEIPCKLQVNSILRFVTPEINDDFAKDMDYETLTEMKAKIAEDLRPKVEHSNIERQHGAIIGKLYQDNPFQPPAKTLHYIVEQQLQNIDPKYRELLRQYYFQQTMQEMVSMYILKSLNKTSQIELNEEMISEYIEHLAIQEDKTPAAYREAYSDELDKEEFRDAALNYHILRDIALKSEFTEPVEEAEPTETSSNGKEE